MNLKNLLSTLLLISFLTFQVFSQTDTVNSKKNQGWQLGGILPALAYDSDVGFRYGLISSFYNYGDGTVYPDYKQYIFAEWSNTTKGSMKSVLQFDSKNMNGTSLRLVGDIGYYTEKALDFYGFNGYEADFNSDYSNDESSEYISRMYYRQERKLFRANLNLQGKIIENKLRWVVGYGFYSTKIGSVNVAKLNKGKDDADKLPDPAEVPGLYENYINWGIIPERDINGGNTHLLMAGLVFDTRDLEAFPSKGIWTEALITESPSFSDKQPSFTTLTFTHRQYLPIYKRRLVFAYRGIFQTKLAGEIPYYMLPYYTSTKETRDGFGGAKTIRGMLRNRLVGDGVLCGNFELRWRAIETKFLGRDLYFAISSFADLGMVTKPFSFEQNSSAPDVKFAEEKLHVAYGAGGRIGLNENFVVAIDYGMAANKQDGKSGIYIGLNWLF